MSRGPLLLAVDAGGTSTRAVVCEPDGTCLSYATGPAGNPTSAGSEAALAAIAGTGIRALARAGREADELGGVLVAMAGRRGVLSRAAVTAALGCARDSVLVRMEPDILAMYYSGSAEGSGCAVIAGTGSSGAQVRQGRVHRAVGGCGWLLGDSGSGFALGHAVVRAAVAELDGTGPATALTDLLLDDLGLQRGEIGGAGRARGLEALMEICYGGRPVALARHAPLAFVVDDDPVAADVVSGAQDDLARLVGAVRDGDEGAPLVLGGGVMHRGLLAPGRARTPFLERALAGADVRAARDGVVGAAVAGIAASAFSGGSEGGTVPADVVERLHRTVETQRSTVSEG